MLPPALEESARSLGRTPAHVFRTVVLPQAAGALAAGSLLTFLYCVSEFGAVSLVRYDTLTLRIEATRLFDRETSITLSLLLAMVALLVVFGERTLVAARARRSRQSAPDVARIRHRWGAGASPALGASPRCCSWHSWLRWRCSRSGLVAAMARRFGGTG